MSKNRIHFYFIALVVTAAFFMGAGILHFVAADRFVRIVPPALPAPRALVAISGVAEIFGGIGLLIAPLRRAAGWGLIVLLVAVFPANIYMALHPELSADLLLTPLLLWARLPLQAVAIAWVWWLSIRSRSDGI